MDSQMAFTNPRDTIRAIHEDQELCEYLLSNIDTTHSLQILPSRIHRNGTGVFVSQTISEGTEIFRSQPSVSCVGDGMYSIICDYCFASSASLIHPAGHFRARDAV